MSAAISTGYVNNPVGTDSPCFLDLSLNWVIRLSSPIYELQVKSQAASECAGTCDCINRVFFSGLIPAAI